MGEVTMPLRTRVVFAHAVVQAIAEEVGVDLLHIKGPALEPEALAASTSREQLAREPRQSVDADVLVRPRHVPTLLRAMEQHGWVLLYDFRGGSPFEHAATLGREGLASVDLHRYFPGIEANPELAFDRLWRDRRTTSIAGRPVQVPSLAAQRLILILHAARRGTAAGQPDVDIAWTEASPDQRTEVDELARDLQAHVALAAGTGRLDIVRGERSHDLWSALWRGESSDVRLWRARVRAAGSRRAALRTGVRLLVPNVRRMTTTLGRRPTTREVASAFLAQFRRGLRAIAPDGPLGGRQGQGPSR